MMSKKDQTRLSPHKELKAIKKSKPKPVRP